MAEESAQDALYRHYGDVELRLTTEPGGGAGMDAGEASDFLRGLRPGGRARVTLAAAAAAAKTGG